MRRTLNVLRRPGRPRRTIQFQLQLAFKIFNFWVLKIMIVKMLLYGFEISFNFHPHPRRSHVNI